MQITIVNMIVKWPFMSPHPLISPLLSGYATSSCVLLIFCVSVIIEFLFNTFTLWCDTCGFDRIDCFQYQYLHDLLHEIIVYIVWYNIVYNWTNPSLIKKWNYMRVNLLCIHTTILIYIKQSQLWDFHIESGPSPNIYTCVVMGYTFIVFHTYSAGYITNYLLLPHYNCRHTFLMLTYQQRGNSAANVGTVSFAKL